MKIRRIQKQDNPAVEKIIIEVLSSFGANREGFAAKDPEVKDMFGHYDAPGAAYWVIEDEAGTVLGGGGVGQLPGGQQAICEIQKMYFLPELRGRGFGKQILRRCLDFAERSGYERAYLETLSSMKPAQALYKKSGFTYLDRPMGDTGHSGCNVWMIKNLDNTGRH